MIGLGYSLDRFVEGTSRLEQVRKAELQSGDLLLITTRNSVYSVYVLDDGFYLVSGGWFDSKGLSPAITAITGCSLGGSIIKMDIVAACGLCLEFGNRVVTTAIQKVRVIRFGGKNQEKMKCNDWQNNITLQSHRKAGSWRHGCGLQGPGHET